MAKSNYIGFKFNGIEVKPDASIYKGFIINDGEDLKFYNLPSFSSEYVTPQFGRKSYLLGTTEEQKVIGFRIMLTSITLANYKKFLRAINPRAKGVLVFDYNENYGYDAKLSAVSEGIFTVVRDCDENQPDLYSVELELEFVTVGDWRAKWVGEEAIYNSTLPSQVNLIENDIGEGQDFIVGSDGTFVVKNFHETENSFVIEISGSKAKITFDGEVFEIEKTGATKITIFSEFGIAVDQDGLFVSSEDNKDMKIILEPWDVDGKVLKIEEATSFTIKPTSREIL